MARGSRNYSRRWELPRTYCEQVYYRTRRDRDHLQTPVRLHARAVRARLREGTPHDRRRHRRRGRHAGVLRGLDALSVHEVLVLPARGTIGRWPSPCRSGLRAHLLRSPGPGAAARAGVYAPSNLRFPAPRPSRSLARSETCAAAREFKAGALVAGPLSATVRDVSRPARLLGLHNPSPPRAAPAAERKTKKGKKTKTTKKTKTRRPRRRRRRFIR